MKTAICIAAIAALVGTCYRSYGPGVLAANDNVIEYQIQGNRYAVVIVREKGMSVSQARKMAQQRAAEMTVVEGNRYFVIESETQVQAVQSSGSGNQFYTNMYQELIVEGDFSKQQTEAEQPAPSYTYPALRVVFVMYPDKSSNSIDACKYTTCPKKLS